MRFKKKFVVMDDTTGAGGGAGGDPNAADKSKQQQGNGTNTQNNEDPFINLWDNNTSTKQDDKQTQTTNQNTNQQQPNQNTDHAAAFDAHIASLGLDSGLDMDVIANDLREGKMDSMHNALKSIGANSYKAAVTDMSRVMDAKIKTAVQEATSQASGSVKSGLAIQEMNTRLPFTGKPEISPVANAVFAQMMKKHNDVGKAIQGVDAFFKHVGTSAGLATPPKGRQTAQQFSSDTTNAGESDWMKVLSGMEQD